ncbi:MAG: hypothetical protein QM706_15655 [Nitrospira sp.]
MLDGPAELTVVDAVLQWLREPEIQTAEGARCALEGGNDSSVNSAFSSPRLTKDEISILRSIFSTSSIRVLVLG